MKKHIKRRFGFLLACVLLVQSTVPAYAMEPADDSAEIVTSVEEGIAPEDTGGLPVEDENDTSGTGTVPDSSGEVNNPQPENQPEADAPEVQVPQEEPVESGTDQAADGIGDAEEPSNTSEAEADKAAGEDKAAKEEAELKPAAEKEGKNIDVVYSTHVQTYGWMKDITGGNLAGTTGEKKRMEAIRIQLSGLDNSQENAAEDSAQTEGTQNSESQNNSEIEEAINGSIEYQAHSQSVGWQDWVKDGEIAGTMGMAKRLEAIRIRLTGTVADKYDIYYRVHSSRFGDLGWAKNGQAAGTEGYARSIEAIIIQLVEKGSADAPQQTSKSFLSPTELGDVTYTSHVQSFGWMEPVADGAMSGTTGKSKRMEAIKIYVGNPIGDSGMPLEGSITYRAHSQSYGWMDWVSEGALAGTQGAAKRLEAIEIKLTGELEQQYDIYYKVHCSTWGDLGWAKNGETAGTTGTARSIESIKIRLVKKGSGDAPTSDKRPSLTSESIGKITYEPWMEGSGWTGAAASPSEAGLAGQNKKMEAFKIQRENAADPNALGGGFSYRAYMQSSGWQGWKADGETAGSTSDGKRVEAFQVKLTGEWASYCKVYYRAYVEKYGWLGWAQDGQTAGTNNIAYRVEAIQIAVVMRTAAAPGSTSGYYQDTEYLPRYNNAINTILNEAGKDLYSCYSWVVNNLSYQTLPIPMEPPAGYTREQGYAIHAVENRRGNCFCYAAAFAGAAKKLGYQARYIEGRVGMARGGTGPHGWVEIDLDGTTYVCDPDGEYELGVNFYMVTYGSARLQYYK